MPVPFAKSDFLPAPEGLQQAICCDVVDKGIMASRFGDKPKVELSFQSERLIPTGPKKGQPFLLKQLYTNSAHEMATLRKHIESWFAKPFTKEALKGWDHERLVGKRCTINVVHKAQDDGSVRASITAILPPMARKDKPALVVVGYQRQEARPPAPVYDDPTQFPQPEEEAIPTDEDVPF